MKKIFLTLASLALLGNGNLWAWAGGPFDNGDPGSLLMERGGYYQCQFSFRNGNGYGIFTPDSLMGGNLPAASAQASAGGGTNNQQIGIFNRGTLYTQNTNNALSRNANRSVFYFKGVSYVGGCFGYVDVSARDIQGVANASSNESITQQTLSQNTGGLINASQQATTQQSLVINATGNILNMGWSGKITSTRPNLRFRGKGELSVVETGRDVQQLATTAYSGLLDAIVQSVSNSDDSPLVFTEAQAAIESALNALQARLDQPSTNQMELHPVRVSGNRRFF
jgi:hypothetical protein